MPTYEYRCKQCQCVSTTVTRIHEKPRSIVCNVCGSEDTFAIVSKQSVRLSSRSKVEKLDPKYDRLVENTMKKNPLADPDMYLKRLADPAKGKSE